MNEFEHLYTNICIWVEILLASPVSKNRRLSCDAVTAGVFLHADFVALSFELATINFIYCMKCARSCRSKKMGF